MPIIKTNQLKTKIGIYEVKSFGAESKSPFISVERGHSFYNVIISKTCRRKGFGLALTKRVHLIYEVSSTNWSKETQ